ncbi:MAG: helix-hairpin-helix domain-containing protein [Acidobacteriaceae bacterium]
MRTSTEGNWGIRLAAVAVLCTALLWMASCAGKSDRQIQQQAQQATEQAKVEARKAEAEAKIAAANATREANDVATGVRAGLHDRNGAPVVNVNAASRADLEGLPGITPVTARRIEQNRPYGTPYDMVRKRVISEAEYNRISGDVVAR